MRRTVAGAVLAAAALVAACGASGPSAKPSSASQAPVATAPIAIPSVSLPASSGRPAASLPAGATTTLDTSLLALLPSSVGGFEVTQEPQSFPQLLTDPAFVGNVDRAVLPLVVGGEDLASGVIAHLRPGVFSDAMFSDWRSTYDNGACQQSANVLAHAQEEKNGRTTYVTTCNGGLRVYHTYVASQGVIISLLSTGPKDFGGQLMAGIKG
ncbi:MAG: hypothetical protein U0838_15445 [Chloroflexota bacterium]